MTTLTFSFNAMPPGADGTNAVHLYVSSNEKTCVGDETPGQAFRAEKNALQVVRDIVLGDEREKTDATSLLQDGEPPADSKPIYMFTIVVTWNRKARTAHYARGEYRRFDFDHRWLPVVEVGNELFDYTFGVLRNRERAERSRLTK